MESTHRTEAQMHDEAAIEAAFDEGVRARDSDLPLGACPYPEMSLGGAMQMLRHAWINGWEARDRQTGQECEG